MVYLARYQPGIFCALISKVNGPLTDLRFVFLDLETFYSKDYTLRSMDPPSYILDERFRAHCMGVAEGFTEMPRIIDGDLIPDYLEELGTDVALVTHNTLFDACILNWRFDYVPKLLIDTLALCRTLLSHKLKSLALRNVADALGFGIEKSTIPAALGMTVEDLQANGMWDAYTQECKDDVSLCRKVFLHLAPLLPPEEFILHDMILRCAVEPAFRADASLLRQNLEETQQRKDMLFFRAMCAGLRDKAQLMSNVELAALFIELGVDPPQKISKTTGMLTHAFAKNDPGFLALLEDDDPRVAALAEARLAFKSTIEETRSERMLNIANLVFPNKGSGWMPIPLKVGGAHTHRLSGDWLMNCQNWGRRSIIRKAVIAPPDHKVVVGDAEQIEARMNAWFCGQWDLVQQFERKEDVYSNFARDEIYHCPVDKKSEPSKRFVGKTGILQLGYQSGWQKFDDTVWLLSYQYEPEPIRLGSVKSMEIVEAYRRRFDRISGTWPVAQNFIGEMHRLPPKVYNAFGTNGAIKVGHNHIIGPNGLPMFYHNLRYVQGTGWVYDRGTITYKLYGGKFLENIIQFLARIATMQAAIRLRKPLAEFNVRLNHTAHDELAYIVHDRFVDQVKELVNIEMSRQPAWAPGLPLACSIGVGQSYGEAK